MRIILATLVILLTLSACETFRGFGQDVQKLGSKIENKADQKSR